MKLFRQKRKLKKRWNFAGYFPINSRDLLWSPKPLWRPYGPPHSRWDTIWICKPECGDTAPQVLCRWNKICWNNKSRAIVCWLHFEVNLAAGSWRLNISASNNRKYARISLYHMQPQLFTSDHGRMEENMIMKNAWDLNVASRKTLWGMVLWE